MSENSTQNAQEKPTPQKSQDSASSIGTNGVKSSTTRPKAKKVAVVTSNDNNSNNEGANKSKLQQKRPKSRIAANFGTPAQ